MSFSLRRCSKLERAHNRHVVTTFCNDGVLIITGTTLMWGGVQKRKIGIRR